MDNHHWTLLEADPPTACFGQLSLSVDVYFSAMGPASCVPSVTSPRVKGWDHLVARCSFSRWHGGVFRLSVG